MSSTCRILVRLQKQHEKPVLAEFTQCVLSYFGLNDGIGKLHAQLRDNFLTLSDTKLVENDDVVVKHPNFCPVYNLTPEIITTIAPEVRNRGIDVGACMLLESSDGKILLSRRGLHLRTFPGLWTPPGGHVEDRETLLEAGLRELNEEVGLSITPKDCIEEKIDLLALWESVYPPKLSVGPPKRHHIVVYFHAKLRKELTAIAMEERTKIDPNEVLSCAWLNKDLVSAIAQSYDEDHNEGMKIDHLPPTFRALTLNANKEQYVADLQTEPLFSIHKDSASQSDTERVSTGTKFALQQLLSMSTAQK
ncbi:nucleoside diphosphate-linked moiety X motif 17 [Aplysia californica]|uniref:m7GpppN-mRNA hydrolase NUDT17 n=1 Tax=Aplysia californica TaxID=6500 RepID=A0ABM0JQW6_APLCA|nr:nucleoside diphosphate-linked moiety X motif 17 [Aplysia californica]